MFEICASMQQGTSVCRELGWEVQGSWFRPQGGQNIVVGRRCLDTFTAPLGYPGTSY